MYHLRNESEGNEHGVSIRSRGTCLALHAKLQATRKQITDIVDRDCNSIES